MQHRFIRRRSRLIALCAIAMCFAFIGAASAHAGCTSSGEFTVFVDCPLASGTHVLYSETQTPELAKATNSDGLVPILILVALFGAGSWLTNKPIKCKALVTGSASPEGQFTKTIQWYLKAIIRSCSLARMRNRYLYRVGGATSHGHATLHLCRAGGQC